MYGLEEDVGWRIQDGCLVYGRLWFVNAPILAISESPFRQKFSIQFLL